MRPLRLRTRVADSRPYPVPGQGEPPGTPDRLEANARHLIRGGQPYLPIMGEYHFSRARAEDWAEELAAIKAGGITVVSTYVLWILHEERRGRIRWDGARDLRRFARLCTKSGLDLVVRIGPWCHGEARYGGLPDWVVTRFGERARTNDPGYLAAVRTFWTELADQLAGQYHRDGGPVIAIQLENELINRPEHLRSLRRLAEAIGMAPGYWTATGWDGARLPLDRVLGLYGGYADGFWEDADVGWPAFGEPNFRFGAARDAALSCRDSEPGIGQPFATCEIGGGMPAAYHRRPLVEPRDVAAMALTKLGSGSVWQGYYLYHGGNQVRLDNGWSQESQATGCPNDLPQVDYDFAAPIGAQGELREHFHLLRQQHLFLAAYGELLAPMPASFPEDRTGLRWAVRADDRSGFLFFNNHQPAAAPLPDRGPTQFKIGLGGQTITTPTRPIRVPSGTFGVLPLNLPMSESIMIRAATVQPLTRIRLDARRSLTVLAALPGIPVEVVIAGARSVVELDGNPSVKQGLDDTIVVRTDGSRTRVRLDPGSAELMIIDPATTLQCWTLPLDGVERLVITEAEPLPAPDSSALIRSVGPARLEVWPALTRPPTSVSGGQCQVQDRADHTELTVVPDSRAPATNAVSLALVREARPDLLPPVATGPNGRILAPGEDAWRAAASWRLTVDHRALEDLHRAVLMIDWTGDIARVLAGNLSSQPRSQLVAAHLLLDQYFSGRPFAIELGRLAGRSEVELQVLPRQSEAPIRLDPRVTDVIRNRPPASVHGLRIRPVHAVRLTFGT